MATCLGAGLHGIEHKLTPPPAASGDASSGASGFSPLPRTLKEATARLEKSEVARGVLGEAFVDHYVRTRDWEVRQFERVVTDWELRRYFETI
jgi:glutamine synthetase